MSLAELALCVDHDDLVTVKCFALAHGLTVSRTTELFAEFTSSGGIMVRYLLSGSLKERPGGLGFRVVAEEDLPEAMQKFAEPPRKTIYSIQKNSCREFSNVAYLTQEEKCSEALFAKPNFDHFVRNLYGGIHTDVTVLPCGERAAFETTSRPQAEKELVSVLTSKVEYRAAKGVVEVSKFFEKSASDKAGKEPAKENSKNDAPMRPEESLQEAESRETAPSVQVEHAEDGQRSPTANHGLEVNSDDEWDDGYKPDKAKLSERPKAFGAPEGTGGGYQPEVESDQEDDASSTKAKSPRKRRNKTFTRGAIDDFVNDSAAADTDRAANKKRKLVPKVKHLDILMKNNLVQLFEDEKGYLVTQMVWEECSVEEASQSLELPKPPKNELSLNKKDKDGDEQPTSQKRTKLNKKQSQQETKSGGTQKSMMSFFAKK